MAGRGLCALEERPLAGVEFAADVGGGGAMGLFWEGVCPFGFRKCRRWSLGMSDRRNIHALPGCRRL